MPLNHYAFRALSFEGQLATIFEACTYLATRWEEEDTVALYHMPGGFFAEVYYDETNHLHQASAFTSTLRLAGYANYVQLPRDVLSS